MPESLSVQTRGQGLHDVTSEVSRFVAGQPIADGICTLFVQHTSASLLIQENYDPSAKLDLENWLNRLVPEGDPIYTHTLEGADDMPAHIKATLTATQLSIPVMANELALGTWQGIFLWEHRQNPHTRRIICHVSP